MDRPRTKLFHIRTIHGFFKLSTWLTAIAGAVMLLLAYHLISGRSSSRRLVRTSLTADQRRPGSCAAYMRSSMWSQQPPGARFPTGLPRQARTMF